MGMRSEPFAFAHPWLHSHTERENGRLPDTFGSFRFDFDALGYLSTFFGNATSFGNAITLFQKFFRYYEAAWACGSTPGVALREYAIVATVVYRMGVRGVHWVWRGLGCGWIGSGWVLHRPLALPSAQ